MKKITVLLGLAALVLTGCKKDDGPDYTLQTLTFENVPAAALAGPTAKGENLYPGYSGGFLDSYTDPTTGLNFSIPYDDEDAGYAGGGGLAMGGAAISRWNNKEVAGQNNQCSVYGEGGNNGSATFSILYFAGFVGPTNIGFENSEEKVIDHLYLSNATWSTLSMKNGDDFTKKLNYEDKDWFRLTITGLDAAGASTGKVEFYLADFRTTGSEGIIEGWKKIDLSSLGSVNKLAFSFDGSDSGQWGLNTPAYVCIDDIAVRQ